MTSSRNTYYHRWASRRLGVPDEQLSLAELERLPTLVDLPDGPGSEMGGETQSVLDVYTESELLELADLGDRLIDQLPSLPAGYRPADSTPRTRC
ncbi:MAG: hypothetical protein WDZ46_06785 [Solirubrobacterales bacterium]